MTNALEQELSRIQKINVNAICKDRNEVMKFKHDINMHLKYIQILGKKRKYNQLIKYIEQFGAKAKEISIINASTGNDLIDAIVSQLGEEAKEDEIQIILNGYMPPNSSISEIDLCTLFYNLISNAIEACQKIEKNSKKKITITIEQMNHALHIIIANPVYREVDTSMLGKGTTKSNKSKHGFGMLNINDVVTKYNGNIEFISGNDEVKVDIILHDVFM